MNSIHPTSLTYYRRALPPNLRMWDLAASGTEHGDDAHCAAWVADKGITENAKPVGVVGNDGRLNPVWLLILVALNKIPFCGCWVGAQVRVCVWF